MPNKVIIPFYAIFLPIKFKKGIFLNILKQDLSYLIHLTYNFFILIKKSNQNELKSCFEI